MAPPGVPTAIGAAPSDSVAWTIPPGVIGKFAAAMSPTITAAATVAPAAAYRLSDIPACRAADVPSTSGGSGAADGATLSSASKALAASLHSGQPAA
jgi:hypothetical protein